MLEKSHEEIPSGMAAIWIVILPVVTNTVAKTLMELNIPPKGSNIRASKDDHPATYHNMPLLNPDRNRVTELIKSMKAIAVKGKNNN